MRQSLLKTVHERRILINGCCSKMTNFQPSSFSRQFTSLELTGVQLTGKKLGKGSDAIVQEVNWLGTLCAAKQLHEILLEDDSAGGAKRFIENFEKECMTWSRLVHPCIVQFLGVHFLSGSRVPMLILEKMDTSLRNYLEAHKKEDFPLADKIYVLRQVAQALSYLHNLSPPLVHHDLSSNNVLLNDISLQAKVTDFGMTRALDHSKMSRKSSVKGTQAFMPPEGLVDPPKYDDKLDIFSYGNFIITTVTHKWPYPGPSKKYQGDELIAVSELQRRQQYIAQFSQVEGALLLPTVRSCLEDRPSQRPTSIQLVDQMRENEATYPREVQSGESTLRLVQLREELQHCLAELQAKDAQLKGKTKQSPSGTETIAQLKVELQQQDAKLHKFCIQLQEKDSQLTQKDTELMQKDTEMMQKDTELKQKDVQLKHKDVQLKQKDAQLKQNDEDSGREYALLLQENQQIQQERDELKHELDQLRRERDQLRREQDQLRRKQDQLTYEGHQLKHEPDQVSTHHQKPSSPELMQPLSTEPLHYETPTKIFSADKQVAEKPPRNWRDMKCQKTLKCSGRCRSVAAKADLIAVSVGRGIELYSKTSNEQLRNITHDQLGSDLCGVAFLDEETIVISDLVKQNLKLFTLKGELLHTIDRGSSTFKPQGVTVSPDGHIYVCDEASHCVCVFDVKGKSLFSFGSQGSGNECFDCPSDLCFASDGLLYITDVNNCRICVYIRDGTFVREFLTTCMPTCIDATDCGHLIVSSLSFHKVMIYTTGGDLIDVFGGHGSGLGQFELPYGVSVDRDGLIYMVDMYNERIQVF